MDLIKRYYQNIVIAIFIATTGIINVIGYVLLPGKIATHMSFNGEKSNYVSSPIYLIISFLIIVVLSLLSKTKLGEKKVKYFVTTAILVIANIAIIISQIK